MCKNVLLKNMKTFVLALILNLMLSFAVLGENIEASAIFGYFRETSDSPEFVLSDRQLKDVRFSSWQWVPHAEIKKSPHGGFVCSGVILHFNVGKGEGIPLFWGLKDEEPKLMALSDDEGKFSFRIPKGKSQRGFLYVTGRISFSGSDKESIMGVVGVSSFTDKADGQLAENSLTARYPMSLSD